MEPNVTSRYAGSSEALIHLGYVLATHGVRSERVPQKALLKVAGGHVVTWSNGRFHLEIGMSFSRAEDCARTIAALNEDSCV
jgi:hypothetical protein